MKFYIILVLTIVVRLYLKTLNIANLHRNIFFVWCAVCTGAMLSILSAIGYLCIFGDINK